MSNTNMICFSNLFRYDVKYEDYLSRTLYVSYGISKMENSKGYAFFSYISPGTSSSRTGKSEKQTTKISRSDQLLITKSQLLTVKRLVDTIAEPYHNRLTHPGKWSHRSCLCQSTIRMSVNKHRQTKLETANKTTERKWQNNLQTYLNKKLNFNTILCSTFFPWYGSKQT